MRTPVYSAHPLSGRQTVPHDRYHKHIDMGEREFEYRLTTDPSLADHDAEVYNQMPYTLSFFPSGAGEQTALAVELDSPAVLLSALKKRPDGKDLVRLFNTRDADTAAVLKLGDRTFEMCLSPFEVRTDCFDGAHLTECGITGLDA